MKKTISSIGFYMKNYPSKGTGRAELQTMKTLFSFLWTKIFFRLKVRVVISIFLLVAAKVLSVTVPIFFKWSVDALSIDDPMLLAIPVFILISYGVARILSQLFADLKNAIFARVEHHAIRSIALEIFKHLYQLSLSFHLERKTGGMSRARERGTRSIETFMRFIVFNIFPTFLEIIFVAVILGYLYNAAFAIVTLITLIIYISYTLIITQWRIDFIRIMNRVDGEASTKVIDGLLNYETVKYFGNDLHETERYDESLYHYQEAAIKSKATLAVLNSGQSLIITTGLVTVMLMAAHGIVNATMTVGDFVLVNAYLIQLYLPLGNLGFAYREIKLALVNMEEMFGLLNVPLDVKDNPGARALLVDKGEIHFDNVSFAYHPKRQILKNVSFTVPPGKTVAVVGPSGAGKSTLSRLLFRFYDVKKGDIQIDGQSILAVTQQSLRAAIGIVPQDTVLFNDTIYYNIAYGRLDATHEEVERASHLARIDSFIKSLPDGYGTLVGERGLKLSGGEKQRVAIARTILKGPNIFLFDEATSALDTHTEKEIQKSLKAISSYRTTLIIAHRLSTVVDADKIIVLVGGEIVERGTHRELLTKGGVYSSMWQSQQRKNHE
jgi:ABC-type transport system involved in Fe-S cluster assembly fused permease/ATPase subunit